MAEHSIFPRIQEIIGGHGEINPSLRKQKRVDMAKCANIVFDMLKNIEESSRRHSIRHKIDVLNSPANHMLQPALARGQSSGNIGLDGHNLKPGILNTTTDKTVPRAEVEDRTAWR